MGALVQHQQAHAPPRPEASGRSRGRVPSAARRAHPGPGTQVTRSASTPGRFSAKIRRSGGRGIRTLEGLPPTRFPSVRPRPLGESSAAKLTRPGPRPGGQTVKAHPVLGLTTLTVDPPHGVYPANPPRAGRQQGYAGPDGCAGGPPITGEDELMAAAASEREGTTTASLA